jgi:hypothetical protein
MPFPEFFAWVNAMIGPTCGNCPRKYERPVAWGTTGLPYEPAWVWGIEALGCVGRGFDERLGGPPAGYVDLSGVGRAGVGSAANFVKSLSDMNYE